MPRPHHPTRRTGPPAKVPQVAPPSQFFSSGLRRRDDQLVYPNRAYPPHPPLFRTCDGDPLHLYGWIPPVKEGADHTDRNGPPQVPNPPQFSGLVSRRETRYPIGLSHPPDSNVWDPCNFWASPRPGKIRPRVQGFTTSRFWVSNTVFMAGDEAEWGVWVLLVRYRTASHSGSGRF